MARKRRCLPRSYGGSGAWRLVSSLMGASAPCRRLRWNGMPAAACIPTGHSKARRRGRAAAAQRPGARHAASRMPSRSRPRMYGHGSHREPHPSGRHRERARPDGGPRGAWRRHPRRRTRKAPDDRPRVDGMPGGLPGDRHPASVGPREQGIRRRGLEARDVAIPRRPGPLARVPRDGAARGRHGDGGARPPLLQPRVEPGVRPGALRPEGRAPRDPGPRGR